MGGGGGSEGAGWSGDVEEVRQIWRGEVVDGLKGVQEQFEFYPMLDREPVELQQDGGDVMVGGGSSDDVGS